MLPTLMLMLIQNNLSSYIELVNYNFKGIFFSVSNIYALLIFIVFYCSIRKRTIETAKKNNTFIITFVIIMLQLMFININILPIIFVTIIIIIGKFTISAHNDFKANTTNIDEQVLKCPKCDKELSEKVDICPFCNENIANDLLSNPVKLINVNDFDPIYNNSEEILLEKYIIRELQKLNIDIKNNLIHSDVLKRKTILNIIFTVLLFVYISLIFFHFPLYTYIIGGILIIIILRVTTKYNYLKYLKKEIKSRPSEKISNILMNYRTSLVNDNKKVLRFFIPIIAIVIALFVFRKPVIIYEKYNDGYAIRFYTFGLNSYDKVEIPEVHNGKKILSLRGNAFSNMPFLKSVILPDSIIEIRGQAFKNDYNLKEVKLPNKLEILGGGAFYNCTSLESISLPDSLIELGGEAFYNAKSLKYVHLSKNLTEIRGDSFEYCITLSEIEIPDSVTRIGGHAFYGDSALTNVIINENSKLMEIGSSAFRACYNLNNITLPKGVYINERAFKESPTIINYYGDALDYQDDYYERNY